MIARKLGYCATSLLLSNGPAALHLAAHVAVAAAGLVLQLQTAPLFEPEANRHETLALWAQLLTVLAAALFIPTSGTDVAASGTLGVLFQQAAQPPCSPHHLQSCMDRLTRSTRLRTLRNIRFVQFMSW